MNFTELGLSPEVLKAVGDVGYAVPTPIQAQAIPYVQMGRDILGCAQTGTGKTASFTLPMIDILASGRARARMPRSLIVTPTRELAAQIAESFERYGKYSNLTKALLIGGSSFTEQEKLLDRGVDVLIATPGRLLDLYERGKIILADVKILVIDEADRMLDMGFIPDVERIVGVLPKIRQTLFFSATMPPEIRRLADAFLMNPKEISVDPPATAAETVTQYLVRVGGDQKAKRTALRTLLGNPEVTSALIFCNRKRDVDILFKSLRRHDFSVAALHGDMAQPVRTATLEQFKTGEVRLLVCSDVAARGLDIPEVSHVFNFDVPVHAEDYIHRIGRTGRAGRSGRAVTLALAEEAKGLAAVTRMLGREVSAISVDGVAPWGAVPAEAKRGGRRERTSARTGRGKRGARGGASKEQPSDKQPRAQAAQPAKSQPQKQRPAKQPREAQLEPVRQSAEDRESEAPVRRRPARQDSSGQSQPFGEHTPAFMLRPVKVA